MPVHHHYRFRSIRCDKNLCRMATLREGIIDQTLDITEISCKKP